MQAWVAEHGALLGAVAAASLVLLVATAALVPVIVIRLPADYFVHRHRARLRPFASRSAGALVLLALKNLVGAVLVLLGVAMLVLPGQGVLTILFGVMLLDFPGKFRLERAIVAQRPVYRAIGWLRRKRGRPRLLLPPRPRVLARE
jgi:hypothetical protein